MHYYLQSIISQLLFCVLSFYQLNTPVNVQFGIYSKQCEDAQQIYLVDGLMYDLYKQLDAYSSSD
jgi:hypothetical protein